MAVAYRRNPHDPRNNVYVCRITLCKGVPMYGFHVGWRFYLKIYMLNPAYMQRLADLLRNGSIMGRPMQPYEVHIPYLLQFMADFGLYGCGWVECQAVTFRAPVPDHDSIDRNQIWSTLTIPSHMITSSKDKPRLSHCAIEIDLLSHHIRNRDTIKPRLLHHDFIERTTPIPPTEKLVHSMAELWRDEERRRVMKGDTQHVPSMYTSGSRHDQDDRGKGPWIHEAEMRAKLDELIRSERARSDFHVLQFDTFVKPAKFQSLVQTALESVTDMFPPELPSSSQRRDDYVGINTSSGRLREDSGDFPTAEVDHGRIFEMLNELETNPRGSRSGEEYMAESPSESPSGVDFDGDLLGRKPEESPEPVTSDEDLELFDYLPLEMPADANVADFSDDLEVNFDETLDLLGNPTVARTSKATAEHTSGHGIQQAVADGENEPQPLRLRGGASAPELKKRKRLPDSSSTSVHKKQKVGLISSSVGRPSSQGQASSFQSLLPDDIFTKATEESKPGHTIPGRANQIGTAKHSHMRSISALYTWGAPPPSTPALLSSLYHLGIPRLVARSAFYSKDDDVPGSTREYGGREFRLVSASLPYLAAFNGGTSFTKSIFKGKAPSNVPFSPFTRIWQIERRPPLLVGGNSSSTNGESILPTSLKSGDTLVSYQTDSSRTPSSLEYIAGMLL